MDVHLIMPQAVEREAQLVLPRGRRRHRQLHVPAAMALHRRRAREARDGVVPINRRDHLLVVAVESMLLVEERPVLWADDGDDVALVVDVGELEGLGDKGKESRQKELHLYI